MSREPGVITKLLAGVGFLALAVYVARMWGFL